VEILIALLLAGLVSAAIYKVYISQNKSYAVQEQVAEMQQNLRAAMFMMTKEIRMAGYDPSREALAGISAAADNTIQFTMDIAGGDTDGVDNDGDGLVDGADDDEAAFGDGAIVLGDGEDITYVHYDSDQPPDGVSDALGRNPGSGVQLLAENIDAINFVYLDADGTPIPTPVANPENIRTVQITLVARADFNDPGYANSNQYRNQNPAGSQIIYTAPGDGHRRKRLTTQIRCRNLGL
jgi:type IV pilus assembly protein PilW